MFQHYALSSYALTCALLSSAPSVWLIHYVLRIIIVMIIIIIIIVIMIIMIVSITIVIMMMMMMMMTHGVCRRDWLCRSTVPPKDPYVSIGGTAHDLV